MTHKDLLTKAALIEELNKLLDRQSVVLSTVLIKNLARINSQFGHDIGDELIEEFGLMLSGLKECEFTAKVSPALYAVISKDAARPRALLKAVQEAVVKLNKSKQFPFLVEISVGATVADAGHGRDVEIWFDQANLAMVYSGRLGVPQVYHESTALDATIRDIFGRLTADDSPPDGMHWVYQPVNYVSDGRIFAYEALCRWDIPGIGSVGPNIFIPIAEEVGIIELIDKWGLMSLEKTHEELFEHGGHCVSFNLSAKTLESDLSFATMIKDMLKRNRDCGCELIIEMTETAVAANRGRLLTQLKELRAHGVRIAIDDFGSGLTSLGAFADVPCDYLKIDGSLLHIEDRRLAKGLLQVAKKLADLLDAKVIVEGVETDEELALVRSVGADFAQGWYFGQPIDPAIPSDN
jgi:EAL domain-containing protein (putative c-di-GMP-specific phosphodiesterase class I)/GGDEF domain-containing protein